MKYYLGVDVGGTKTDTYIANQDGEILGFGRSGPGNPQHVGYDGLRATLHSGLGQALGQAGISAAQVSGAGLGIAGYDWPSALPRMRATVATLGLGGDFQIVNDTIPGLVAGATDGWGISIISGTGCNCRGWNKDHTREGRVTGYGEVMGEAGGAIEVVIRAMHTIGYAWGKRITPTALSDAFIAYAGASDLEDLVEGYTEHRYPIGPAAAPLVIAAAQQGDPQAIEIMRWAGHQLGEMACSVTRQLEFEQLAFDVVMVGSMFLNNPLMTAAMRETIHALAPAARLLPLEAPPVMGSVLIGMEQGGLPITPGLRQTLVNNLRAVIHPSQPAKGE